MSLQIAAQHLSSKGRGPDDMLVHMSRGEVKNLNTLANAYGGKLTINPQTGLPEAGFLSMVLPMIAGAALGPAGFGLTAMQAGLAVGAGSYLLNPKGGLMGGLSAGLGGYGGAGLGAGLGSLGTSEAGVTTQNAATKAAADAEAQAVAERTAAIQQQAAQSANAITPSATMPEAYQDFGAKTGYESASLPTPTGGANVASPQLQPLSDLEKANIRMGAIDSSSNLAAPPSGLSNMYEGAKSLVTDPSTDKLKQLGGGSYMGLAQKGLAAAAPAAAENFGKMNGLPITSTASKQQSVPHYRFSPGMVTPTPAAGAKGAENTYFNPSYTALSDAEAANLYPGYPAAKAAGGGLMGYAGGGTPYEPISGNSDVTSAATASDTGSPTGSALGDFGYAVSNQSVSPVAAAIADAAMSALSSTSVNSASAINGLDSNSDAAAATGLGSAAGAAGVAGEGSTGMGSDVGGEGGGSGAASSDGGSGTGSSSDGGSGSGSGGDGGGSGEARGGLSPYFKHYLAGGATEDPYRTTLDDSLEAAYAKAQEKNDIPTMRAIEREKEIRDTNKAGMTKGLSGMKGLAMGGLSNAQYNLGGYSDGGRLLRGPGDGVSDSIPAVIGKKQPARLADGEFVVPARIVSEIGNGSTEAGARKLYAMMDRIQAARGKTVGKGKVAKNTRADKYLPA